MTNLLLILLLLPRGILIGQVHPTSEVGRDVPAPSLRAGTPPIGMNSTNTSLDSLELTILEFEIQKAEERVAETSFWRRLLPEIHSSMSFGIRDLVFVDPTTFVPYIIPRDAYRLTISLSLNEVLNSSHHTLAVLDLERLKREYAHRELMHDHLRKVLAHQLNGLKQELATLHNELRILEELLRFNQLRFEQGQIEFDALMRTRLELLNARRNADRLAQQKIQLELRLSEGVLQ